MPRQVRRWNPGDAANIYVRMLLSEVGRLVGGITDEQWERTRDYFEGRCAYTGEELPEGRGVMEHAVPINREHCGVHAYGNVLPATKTANKAKSGKHYRDYMKTVVGDDERLARIETFVRESGYEARIEPFGDLRHYCEMQYRQVVKLSEVNKDYLRNFVDGAEKAVIEAGITAGVTPIPAVYPPIEDTLELSAPEIRKAKTGSVVAAIYDALDGACGVATVAKLSSVAAEYKRPKTGKPMGKSAMRQNIKRMVAKRRLLDAAGKPVEWLRATPSPRLRPAPEATVVESLPIALDPPEPEFKKRLLSSREAYLITYYADGRVASKRWNASRFKPMSNVIGNLRSRPQHRPPRWRQLGISHVLASICPVFVLTLEKTCYDNGFFNVPVDYDRYVGVAGPVELGLGKEETVRGWIDRDASTNGTVCIYGGARLRDWFRQHYSQGDGVPVRLRSPGVLELG